MEYTDLEDRIRQLECLLMRAKEDGVLGMVVYYQVMIEELLGKIELRKAINEQL